MVRILSLQDIPKEQGCLPHRCGTEVWIWCSHAGCDVQSCMEGM